MSVETTEELGRALEEHERALEEFDVQMIELKRQIRPHARAARQLRHELLSRVYLLACPNGKCGVPHGEPCKDLRFRDGRAKNWPHAVRVDAYLRETGAPDDCLVMYRTAADGRN